MLNKGHHTTPTFLEGTSGLYQRRESPPNVPGTAPTYKKLAPSFSGQPPSANNNQTPVFHAQYYKHQSNPGSSTQLHAVNITNNNNSNQNSLQQHYVQHGPYFGKAPRPSASSTSLPMAASNMIGMSQATYIPQYTQNQQQAISPQRRLSHTPHGNRTVAPRSELSSHSFSSPRQLQVNNYPAIQEQLIASSIPHFIQHPPTTQQQRYSVSSTATGTIQQTMQNTRDGSELPHRVLTSSHSIGNVVQHDQPYYNSSYYQSTPDHQAFPLSNSTSIHSSTASKYQSRQNEGGLRAGSAGSAQSLSTQQHYMLRKHDSASPATNSSFFAHENNSSDLPLPPNWELEITGDGYRYYVDHRNKRTSWVHPLAPENLPLGWTKIYDQKHGVVYYNEIERRSQFEHPGIQVHSSASSSTASKKQHPILQHQHSVQQTSQPSTTLADRIRQSSSIQSIIQHQKQQLATQQRPIQQHHQSQPLPLYQPPHQYYLTDIGSLNIITEEVPDWLRLYGEAPPQSDHLLNWTMFKMGQLQQFDLMLRKLYKQEVINTVSKYERARGEINGELLRRFQRS